MYSQFRIQWITDVRKHSNVYNNIFVKKNNVPGSAWISESQERNKDTTAQSMWISDDNLKLLSKIMELQGLRASDVEVGRKSLRQGPKA